MLAERGHEWQATITSFGTGKRASNLHHVMRCPYTGQVLVCARGLQEVLGDLCRQAVHTPVAPIRERVCCTSSAAVHHRVHPHPCVSAATFSGCMQLYNYSASFSQSWWSDVHTVACSQHASLCLNSRLTWHTSCVVLIMLAITPQSTQSMGQSTIPCCRSHTVFEPSDMSCCHIQLDVASVSLRLCAHLPSLCWRAVVIDKVLCLHLLACVWPGCAWLHALPGAS